MLISDWSSDVCSSNLDLHRVIEIVRVRAVGAEGSKLIGVAIDVPAVRCAQVDLVRDRAGRELAADAGLPGFVVVVARDVRSGHKGIAGRGIGDPQALIDAPFGGVARACRRIAEKIFRSEEHTSELQSLMRISYAVFC